MTAPCSLETILLVDDEELILRLMERLPSFEGYDVLAAPDPETGLYLTEKLGRHIDLLVTDVMLPKFNGVKLAQQVLARCPHVRTVFITGLLEAALSREGLDPKTAHVVFKPFSICELLQKVRKVLDELAVPQPATTSFYGLDAWILAVFQNPFGCMLDKRREAAQVELLLDAQSVGLDRFGTDVHPLGDLVSD